MYSQDHDDTIPTGYSNKVRWMQLIDLYVPVIDSSIADNYGILSPNGILCCPSDKYYNKQYKTVPGRQQRHVLGILPEKRE